jgi:hypothetical protein
MTQVPMTSGTECLRTVCGIIFTSQAASSVKYRSLRHRIK